MRRWVCSITLRGVEFHDPEHTRPEVSPLDTLHAHVGWVAVEWFALVRCCANVHGWKCKERVGGSVYAMTLLTAWAVFLRQSVQGCCRAYY